MDLTQGALIIDLLTTIETDLLAHSAISQEIVIIVTIATMLLTVLVLYVMGVFKND